jgi:putative salt-induced outer membrane protein YdiY
MFKKFSLLSALFYLCFSITSAQEVKAPEKAPEKAPIKKYWTHSSGLGVVITSGNSETTTANLSHSSIWEKENNKLSISLNGAYGVRETVNATGDKHNDEFVANINELVQYNRKFSDSFYWFVSEGVEIDKIINLEYRLTVGPGLGYSALKRETVKLDFELGAVYINQKYEDINSEDNVSARVAEKFNWKISTTSNLWFNVEALFNLEESEDYRINAELGVDVKINQNWMIRSTITDKYNNAAIDPTEKNDIIFMTSIVYKY